MKRVNNRFVRCMVEFFGVNFLYSLVLFVFLALIFVNIKFVYLTHSTMPDINLWNFLEKAVLNTLTRADYLKAKALYSDFDAIFKQLGMSIFIGRLIIYYLFYLAIVVLILKIKALSNYFYKFKNFSLRAQISKDVFIRPFIFLLFVLIGSLLLWFFSKLSLYMPKGFFKSVFALVAILFFLFFVYSSVFYFIITPYKGIIQDIRGFFLFIKEDFYKLVLLDLFAFLLSLIFMPLAVTIVSSVSWFFSPLKKLFVHPNFFVILLIILKLSLSLAFVLLLLDLFLALLAIISKKFKLQVNFK